MNLNRWDHHTLAEKTAQRILFDIKQERESITMHGMELTMQSMHHQLDYADVYARVRRHGSDGQFIGEKARRRRNQCMQEKAALSMQIRTYRGAQAHLRDTAAERFDDPIWNTGDVTPITRARRDVEMETLETEDWEL